MNSQARAFFAFTLALLLPACSSAPTVESGPTGNGGIYTPAPAFISTALPAATSTSLPAIPPIAASVTSLDERLLASFTILKEPDEMVFVRGFIWTKTADGHVVQIDPATNTVIADIKVDTTSDPFHYCQGMGTDGENIWVCSAAGDADHRAIDVVRLDPESRRIVETIKVAKIFEQLDMPFFLDQIWVLSGSGDQLVGIDVATNQPASTIELGARCFQLALVDNALMASCALEDLVLRIDVEKKEVTARVALKRPGYIAGNEDGVWVAQSASIVRLDPTSLSPLVTFTDLPEMDSGDIFVTKQSVWVRHKRGFIFHIDPASNQIVEQISTDQNLAGGSVLVTADSIWATAYDDNLLFRLRLR